MSIETEPFVDLFESSTNIVEPSNVIHEIKSFSESFVNIFDPLTGKVQKKLSDESFFKYDVKHNTETFSFFNQNGNLENYGNIPSKVIYKYGQFVSLENRKDGNLIVDKFFASVAFVSKSKYIREEYKCQSGKDDVGPFVVFKNNDEIIEIEPLSETTIKHVIQRPLKFAKSQGINRIIKPPTLKSLPQCICVDYIYDQYINEDDSSMENQVKDFPSKSKKTNSILEMKDSFTILSFKVDINDNDNRNKLKSSINIGIVPVILMSMVILLISIYI